MKMCLHIYGYVNELKLVRVGKENELQKHFRFDP